MVDVGRSTMSTLTFNGMPVERAAAEACGGALVAVWGAMLHEKHEMPAVKLLKGTEVALGGIIASGSMVNEDEESIKDLLKNENLLWDIFTMAWENMMHPKSFLFDAADPRIQNFAQWTGYKLPKPKDMPNETQNMGKKSIDGGSTAGDKDDECKSADDVEETMRMRMLELDAARILNAKGDGLASGSGGVAGTSAFIPKPMHPGEVFDVEKETAQLTRNRADMSVAKKDLTAHEIGAERMLKAILAQYTRKMVTREQLEGVVYRADLATCPLVAALRKAKVKMLPDVVASKDTARLTTHFTRLSTAYSLRKSAEEANILSQILAGLLGLGPNLFPYLEKAMVKYEGRLLPIEIDGEVLITVSTANMTCENVETRVTAVLRDNTAVARSVQTQIDRAVAAALAGRGKGDGPPDGGRGRGKGEDAGRGRGRGRGRLANVECYECGELGHIGRNCPHRNNGTTPEDVTEDQE